MGEKNNVLVSLLVNTTGIKKDQEAGLQTPPMDWVQRDKQTARLYALIAKSEPNKSHKASYTRMDPYSTDSSTHTLLSSDETSIKMTCCWMSWKKPDSRMTLIHSPNSCPERQMGTAKQAPIFKSGLFHPLSANLLIQASTA